MTLTVTLLGCDISARGFQQLPAACPDALGICVLAHGQPTPGFPPLSERRFIDWSAVLAGALNPPPVLLSMSSACPGVPLGPRCASSSSLCTCDILDEQIGLCAMTSSSHTVFATHVPRASHSVGQSRVPARGINVPGAPGWLSRLSVPLGSGHDLTVHGFESRVRLCADSLEPGPPSDSVSPSLCPSPTPALSLSLKNKD